MARRKTKSRSKSRSRIPLLLWLFTLFSGGGGVGGYLNPDWPIIGPIVTSLIHWRQENPDVALDGNLIRQAVNDEIHNATNAVVNQIRPNTNPYEQTSYGQNASIQNGQVVPAQYAAARGQNNSSQHSTNRRPIDKLLIATFNIQVFGKSKMAKPEVVDVLAKVVRHFDLVAIQEVRAQDDNILPDFIRAINADGSQYGFIIGPRIGRTSSTEQYVYVFDQTRVEYDPNAVGTMTDPSDMLHREPFVARFRARTGSPQHAFTFWMVNTHTDPDEVPQEVAALADAFEVMQRSRKDEDDVILLGDLNADETQMGRLGTIPAMGWVVRGAMTNTRKNKAYDNILFSTTTTREFTGRWGVFDIEKTFGLTRQQALAVSDHLPVWAEFSVWEAPTANRSVVPR
ncbi:Endonuclease/Exonuclease/phosphatase family protein [Planctomycetes bacterium CA13]|uniref:Endonuclease/Exonuclease/phosphatase family protein n=1 Tax=Novipirellula herctigrandis TaxID=2527986 RepID=A0A5C5ZAX2_9BACT|nr:Endonuclease/Exonuclease/phosphatase family protein [Planctomycetes bacterium CA13]